MAIDTLLERYPKTVTLKDGSKAIIRPLEHKDTKTLHEFFTAIPEMERLFMKQRVTDLDVVRSWCRNIDYLRNLPLLAVQGDKIVADGTLHQQQGGWKRHIGRISIVVRPQARAKGLAKVLVAEMIYIAQHLGLERLEAEFLGDQKAARHVCATLGFNDLLILEGYCKDMQALTHDYVLMGRKITTDEEFAGAE
ncbi:MAG: GNAT family N-acetyltransferase [Verrucomicrobiae bacterium]|nr:GNAT family N-acetyltransferase [Verrucomicrobiae bacterium]